MQQAVVVRPVRQADHAGWKPPWDGEARSAGIKRVYWQTHESNTAGRLLYDKVAQHAGFIVYSTSV